MLAILLSFAKNLPLLLQARRASGLPSKTPSFRNGEDFTPSNLNPYSQAIPRCDLGLKGRRTEIQTHFTRVSISR